MISSTVRDWWNWHKCIQSFDDPLEAAVFSVLVKMIKFQEKLKEFWTIQGNDLFDQEKFENFLIAYNFIHYLGNCKIIRS